jgi:ABC-2 type transport system permease protein
MMSDTLVLFRRELKKWVNRKPVLVMSVLTPILWIALFGKSFNITNLFNLQAEVNPQFAEIARSIMEKRIEELFGTTDYFTYMTAGMLVVFALFQGMFSGVSVIFDKRLGYMDRILVTPTPRISVWLAKILAVGARVSILSIVLLAVAIPMGFSFKQSLSPIDLVMAWLIIIMISFTLAGVYTMISFYADNQEIVFATNNLINLPLMFTSSALFPVEQMPHWLQVIAKANPVTYAADLVRYHLIGRAISNYTLELAILLAYTVLTLLLSGWLSVRWMKNR